MSETSAESLAPVPILYVTDLAYTHFDPADLFDLAFLSRSPNHTLRAICLTDGEETATRF
jgi:hypothetical protein